MQCLTVIEEALDLRALTGGVVHADNEIATFNPARWAGVGPPESSFGLTK